MTKTLLDDLKDALKNWHSPEWIATNPLLASPYILAATLDIDNISPDPTERSRLLKRLLNECMEELDLDKDLLQKRGFSYENLLQIRYFKRLNKEQAAIELNISPATYHRHLPRATENLEPILANRLKAALRLEQPMPINELVGRDSTINHCLQALQQNQAIALIGPGGIGKTTLGSYLVQKCSPKPAFWFTFYPGFNDQLDGLLFSLAYFFHQQGVSTLWAQMLVQHQHENKLSSEDLERLIHHDLAKLPQPLLCFDEVDLLRIGEIDAHTEIGRFIERLRGQTPLILIGQRSWIETDLPIRLEPLTSSHIYEWFGQEDISCYHEQLERLHQYTEGNPRLLQLCITLYKMYDNDLDTIITHLSEEPSVEFLLNRIWQRLTDTEKRLLMQLSLFRRPISHHVKWEVESAEGIWTKLIELQLVRQSRGAISLNPTYRAVLYNLQSRPQREILHQKAAQMRISLLEYTAALYHFVQANRPGEAIQLWQDYGDQEIDQGKARTALDLFNDISITHLSETEQEQLRIIQGKLAFFVGDFEKAKQALGSSNTIWQMPEMALDAHRLAGNIADLESDFDAAVYRYRRGLAVATELRDQQLSLFHKDLSWAHMSTGNLDLAWQEAQTAYYEAENVRGFIQYKLGNYDIAEQHYQTALMLAEELQYQEGLAKTYINLSGLYSIQNKLDESLAMNQKALDINQELGRMVYVANGITNQALVYMFKSNFVEAIELGHRALKLYGTYNMPAGISTTSQTIAESHLALNQLDQAQKYAEMVMDSEETEGIPDALRVLGEIELKRGNYPKAQQYIQQSIDLALENQDPFLEAYGWRALGQVHQAQQDEIEAKASFDKAIALFEEMGLENEIEKTQAMIDNS